MKDDDDSYNTTIFFLSAHPKDQQIDNAVYKFSGYTKLLS